MISFPFWLSSIFILSCSSRNFLIYVIFQVFCDPTLEWSVNLRVVCISRVVMNYWQKCGKLTTLYK